MPNLGDRGIRARLQGVKRQPLGALNRAGERCRGWLARCQAGPGFTAAERSSEP